MMKHRHNQAVTAVILALTLGWHWTVLQSVAWVSMAFKYSRDGTFATALSKTFDGRHPCALCHWVEQGKKSERQHPQGLAQAEKYDLFLDSASAYYFLPLGLTLTLLREPAGGARVEPPPLPPPRAA